MLIENANEKPAFYCIWIFFERIAAAALISSLQLLSSKFTHFHQYCYACSIVWIFVFHGHFWMLFRYNQNSFWFRKKNRELLSIYNWIFCFFHKKRFALHVKDDERKTISIGCQKDMVYYVNLLKTIRYNKSMNAKRN